MSNKNFLDLGEVAETIIADFNLEIEKHKMISFLIDLCKDEPTTSLYNKDQKLVLFARSSDQVNPTYIVTNGDTTHSYSTNKGLIVNNKTINIAKLAETLNTVSTAFLVTIPQHITANLFKHLSEDLAEGAKGGTKKEYEFNTYDIDYKLISEIYPLTNQVYISVRRSSENTEVFSFNHVFSFDKFTTATDKEVKMNNSANTIRTNSFRAAADMIEAVFDVEDWRRDGTIQGTIEELAVNESKSVKVNDLEDVVLTRPAFVNSYKGIKIEAKYNGATMVFIVSPEREEEEDDGYRAPFKSFMTGLRAKATLKKLKSATSPMEAFNILTEWLAEDQDHEGKFSYKDMVVMYSFKYNKHQRSILSSITVGNKVKCEGCGDAHDMEVIFSLSANLTQNNVDKFYGSVKSFVQNFLD